MKKLLCSLFALSAVSTAMAQEVNIKLLGTSDVHGRIVPWSYGADVEGQIWFLCTNCNLCERCA